MNIFSDVYETRNKYMQHLSSKHYGSRAQNLQGIYKLFFLNFNGAGSLNLRLGPLRTINNAVRGYHYWPRQALQAAAAGVGKRAGNLRDVALFWGR
jgi:hypothetical protein